VAATPSFVIVGASLAGATAAQTLRTEGFTGRITLIGEESHRPYERPPLSKGYLLGDTDREKVFVHPQSWYAENDIDLRLGASVTRIYRDAHNVTLADKSFVTYDALLLSTGSTPRILRLPGADLDGVLYLRRLEDSEQIKTAFARGPRVVIIGAGWIGLETAAAARAAGLDVTVLEQADLPLLRVLGYDVAQVFADLHLDHKVDLRCGVEVAAVTGAEGRVTGVELGDGSRLDADLVLVGVGITPNAYLAEDAGLEIDDGILVSERLQTSDPAIYAAGDVANAYHPFLRRNLRVEHWANARRQGATAAKAMLGQAAVYDRLPYFFSDQYDVGMEYTGFVDPAGYDEIVFRGDVAGREFVALWLADGRVLAGMNVNVWDVTGSIEKLITSRRQVDPARLADASVPLDNL
jgi:3-phenylpropionate/trans-cinnamate dioxygenase ferredoxin reductase subunit